MEVRSIADQESQQQEANKGDQQQAENRESQVKDLAGASDESQSAKATKPEWLGDEHWDADKGEVRGKEFSEHIAGLAKFKTDTEEAAAARAAPWGRSSATASRATPCPPAAAPARTPGTTASASWGRGAAPVR